MNWFSRFGRLPNFVGRLLRSNDADYTDQAHEEPEFHEVLIWYHRVFDLGTFVNPTSVARKLLDEDFALSAPNYLTNDIEVATRFRELAQLRTFIRDLSAIREHLDKGGVLSLARWAARHPYRSWRLWRFIRRNRTSRQEQLDSRSNEGENEHETDNQDFRSIVDETIKIINESMQSVGLFESLQRQVDRTLFNPQYLRDIPFTRVGLQPFFMTTAGENIGIDVSLLIHRTGVAILTFYVMFEESKSVEDLIKLQVASQVSVANLEIVRAILEPQARSVGMSLTDLDQVPSDREFSSGVEWFIYHREEGTLEDIFDLYQTAITAAVQGKQPSSPDEPWSWLRTPDWLIYSVVFVRRIVPEISTHQIFKQRYSAALAGLVQRTNW